MSEKIATGLGREMAKKRDVAVSLRLTVRGRVQGVGFRYALAEEARSRKLSGWVRNRRDGSVEVVVHGAAADVAAIVAWSRRGPAAASVTEVQTEARTAEADGELEDFSIAPTA